MIWHSIEMTTTWIFFFIIIPVFSHYYFTLQTGSWSKLSRICFITKMTAYLTSSDSFRRTFLLQSLLFLGLPSVDDSSQTLSSSKFQQVFKKSQISTGFLPISHKFFNFPPIRKVPPNSSICHHKPKNPPVSPFIRMLTVVRQTMTHSDVCRWRPTDGWPAAVAVNLKG